MKPSSILLLLFTGGLLTALFLHAFPCATFLFIALLTVLVGKLSNRTPPPTP